MSSKCNYQVGAAALLWDEVTGDMLLAKRRATGAYDDAWAFPGGGAEPHESMQEVAAREIDEELGLGLPPDRYSLLGIHERQRADGSRYLMAYLRAKVTPAERRRVHNREPEKCAEIRWFPLEEMPRDSMLAGDYQVLDAALRAPARPWAGGLLKI